MQRRWVLVIGLLVVLGQGTSRACTGTACIEIWSTADGSGALTLFWDFAKVVQTYQSFCASDGSACLYSSIDPGFMAPDPPAPADGLYRIADGTKVIIQVVAADAGLSIHVNGQKLYQPGDSAQLGIQSALAPIHNHPSWQIVVPENQYGDFNLAYKLTTDSPAYTESQVFTQVVTNVPPPEGTPTPSPAPTATPTPCPGDCDANGSVTINEIVLCVNMTLGSALSDACPACDVDGDGIATVNEIIAAVNAALNGCPMPAPATLDEIQATIFTPSCATASCHNALSKVQGLDLSAGASYDQLVNVSAITNPSLLRVDPGHPEDSFVLTKITGPPPGEGMLMPLTGAALRSDQIQLIRDWILQGAQP